MAHHLVLSVAIVALALLAPCAAVYPWPVCGNTGNYTANSNYLANINSTGATLPKIASTTPDLFATTMVGDNPEQVWALALCRGDTNASYCLSCLEHAFQVLPNACAYAKDATIYYDSCLLHYTNIPFSSTDDTAYSPTYRLSNNLNATAEPARFQRFVAALVHATAYYAAYNSTRLFASGEADFDQELPKVYSWAQCTPDMTPARCQACLFWIMESLPRLSKDSIGAGVLGIRCSYRYETKPFYDGPVMVQLPATSNSSGAPTPAPDGEGSKRTDTKTILIVLTSAAAILLFPCVYVLIWHRKGKILHFLLCKRTSSSAERNYEAMIVSYGSLAPKRYMYSEVMKITSSRNNQLGKGGYGVVFKGRLHDGRLVAVKFLHDCKGNGDEFLNEVMSIGRTSHVNIVSLFGFCLDGSKRALIYEYMSNGSLDRYIYSKNPKEILGWERLYAIAISIARGLEYLHHSCNTRIVHFDIKPQNILLDQDFCPKIADFGLAKLCRTKESMLSMTGARGTIGFIAPEVHSRTFGVVSTKSDVYSYGMMLLEMIGGRKNVKPMAEKSSEKYFPDWIYDHFAQDDGLQACEVTSELAQIARKMTLIGLWCIQVLPVYRPTITKVLEMFERSLDELDMPPKQNFCELFEDSTDNMTVQSASSTSPGKAQQVLSEVIQLEETSLVNSKILKHLPTL